MDKMFSKFHIRSTK